MRRLGLGLVAAVSILLLAASLVDHPAAAWVAAAAAAAFPVALIGFNLASDWQSRQSWQSRQLRPPRHGRTLAIVLGLLFVLLEGGLLGLLALAGRPPIWLGPLPLAAALQWLVLGLLPLPLVAFGYALTFDDDGPAER